MKKNKFFIFILVILSAALITGCSDTKNENINNSKKPKILSKKDLGLDKIDSDLDHVYIKITDKETGEPERLLKDDKRVIELADFANIYLESTQTFNYATYDEDKEVPFLSKEALEAYIKYKDDHKEEILKDEAEIRKELNKNKVDVQFVEISDIPSITLSPTEKHALVFVDYKYTIAKINNDLTKDDKKRINKELAEDNDLEEYDELADIFEENLLSNKIILNLVKENDEWRIFKTLDGNIYTNLDDIKELQKQMESEDGRKTIIK